MYHTSAFSGAAGCQADKRLSALGWAIKHQSHNSIMGNERQESA
jgi:hypothetical protein